MSHPNISLEMKALPKKVFWRGVAEELLWFVKGSANAKEPLLI